VLGADVEHLTDVVLRAAEDAFQTQNVIHGCLRRCKIATSDAYHIAIPPSDTQYDLKPVYQQISVSSRRETAQA
jgi:hypothetical protein